MADGNKRLEYEVTIDDGQKIKIYSAKGVLAFLEGYLETVEKYKAEVGVRIIGRIKDEDYDRT